MNKLIIEKALRLVHVNSGFEVKLDGYVLNTTNNDLEIEIHLDTFLDEFKEETDEKILCDAIVQRIQSKIRESKRNTDLKNVFPILKAKGFGVGHEPKLLRDSFTPELDIFYVEEKDKMISFLVEDDTCEIIRKRAIGNLNLHFFEPVLENEEMSLLKYPFSSFLNNSMLLLEKTRKFLEEKYGDTALMIIPNESFVLYIEDNEFGQFYLEHCLDELIKKEKWITISDKIFRWNFSTNTITNINIKESLKIVEH